MPFILKLHPRIYWVDTAEPVADVKPTDTVSSKSSEISMGKDKRGLLGLPTLRGATVTFICLALPSYSTQTSVDINSYVVAIDIIKLRILDSIELHCHHMAGNIAIGVCFIEKAKIWVPKCSRKASWWCNGKGKAIVQTLKLGHDSTDKSGGEGESRGVGLSKPLEVIWAIPSRLRLAELNPLNVNSRSPDVAKHS
nr:hypothetical protein POPTR_T083000 [Ipomoea batatas]